MNRAKLRTVVCGSTFGQFYLEALKLLPEEFELVGLVARGSARSQKCAAYYGLKLYTEVRQLPPDIDVACVVLRSTVLGGQGTNVSLQLLERGIHVIQEQPVHQQDLAACLRMARRQGVIFRTGDLYLHLPAVRRFRACAQAMLERQKALYVDAAFASQVSYPALHILAEVLPTLRPWRLSAVIKEEGPFQVLTGTLGKIPAIMRVHNEVNPEDPDNYLHLLHQITIGSAGGSLALTDTHGPVVWRPRLHVPKNLNTFGDFDADSENLLEKSTETLGPAAAANYMELLTKQWPQAIACDLAALRETVLGTAAAERRAQRELMCSGQWQEITQALGYPVLRSGCRHQPLPVRILKDAAAKAEDQGNNRQVSGLEDGTGRGIAWGAADVDSELGAIDVDEIRLFVAKLDEAVFHSMLYVLQSHGVLSEKEREYEMAAILAATDTAPERQDLLKRWLDVLAGRGYLQRRASYFSGHEPVTTAMRKGYWDQVRQIWDGRLGSPLVMDYLIDNVKRLSQLLSGKQSAALLLFPEGKMDYANALYRETVIARYLNKSVAEAVFCIGAARRFASDAGSVTPLRILEVGAGTGATTAAVISRLKASDAIFKTNYWFTDISPFFLTAAREQFRDCPWLLYQVADLDQDLTRQGLRTESFNLIIAAGVLNNCGDTEATVKRLIRTLLPGGWLLVTEPVREFPEIMISQAFMMTRPHDERQNTNTTFLSVEKWRKVFQEAGATVVLTLPEEAHPLAPFGQKLFGVRREKHA
ncbi:MAG: Gfo/Idh/MocA family oxidoreductase [Bacillota bacterium]|jgi:thiazolinyl imide reductase